MKNLKLFSLALMALFATSVWATCDPGTIFKFEVKDGLTSGNIAKGDPIDLSSYVTVTAGSVSAYGKNDGSLAVDNAKYLKIAKKSEAYFICELSDGCSLQAGDIIRYSISSYNALLQPATDSGDDDKLALAKPSSAYTLQTATIPVGHALIGESTFYIFAPSNGGLYKSIEIIRPITITLDATTNGGTAVADAKGLVGDKVVLPHAFKKDAEPLKYYKFKGWYDNASAGTKQADYYTVASATTLYAQFEDNPTSGTMFSLAMQSSMKPASEVTVKSGTGFVTELDLLQYALISGGAAKLKNSSTNNHAKITTSGQISLAGSNGNVQIDLDFPLQAGDVIAPNVSAKTWITTGSASAKPSDGPYVDNSENKTYTVTAGDGIVGTTSFKLWNGSNATTTIITITRPATHTLSSVVNPTGKGTVALGATSLIEGATTTATYSNIDEGYEFDEWQISGTGASIEDASANPATITMGTDDATVTLKLKVKVAKYAITKGTHANGDFTISPAEQAAGEQVTLNATPNTGYLFNAWEVVKTEDGSSTGITVDGNNQFTMPAYAVTVNATFNAIPTHKITYTNTKGADNSANPTEYLEGTGVASFTKLRHVVGYDFTGWNPSSISASATTDQTIEAQWTEKAATTGDASLTYAFAFGSGTVTTSSITRVNGSLYDATDLSLAHTSFSDNSAKNGCSGKLTTTSSKLETNYLELTFKIAEGYLFTPSEVSVKANAVSTNKTMEVELKDNAATPNSKSVTEALAAGSTSGGVSVSLDFDETEPVTLEGTVTLKIFVYGAEDAWRLGTSIVISGTVAEKTYAVTFDNPSNGTLAVKNGEVAITSGDAFVAGTTLDVVATPNNNDYALTALTAGETDILSDKQFTVGTEDIAVSATFTEKLAAPISWASETASIALNGDAATLQSLTNAETLTVAYSSDDTDVASINAETGEITLKAAGTANITATYSSTAEGAYKTTEVSYELTVTAATYAVNIAAGIVNGTVEADKSLAAAGETVTITATPASGYKIVSVTVDEEKIESVDDKYSFIMPAKDVTVSAIFAIATAITNTSDAAKAQKRIENGQLVIEKNGQVFNAMGQTIR